MLEKTGTGDPLLSMRLGVGVETCIKYHLEQMVAASLNFCSKCLAGWGHCVEEDGGREMAKRKHLPVLLQIDFALEKKAPPT